ncbi:MAG: ATP-binding protein [Verrucomicrobiia bacterium]
MIARALKPIVEKRLQTTPAVALLGPRQAGKTTLALEIARSVPSIYLDLESEADRSKLSNPELYLAGHEEKLVILDEVQRCPQIFQSLRGLIDRGRRRGLKSGRFLLLGSASLDLLRQSGESLAGRIAYLELTPLLISEVGPKEHENLWLRGGFPDSFLAGSEEESLRWRRDFIRTYLERDIPQLGPRIAAETLRRFWTMLAHHQGGLHNAASLARGLAVDGKTVASYLDLLVDLMLVRRLEPWHGNIGKRLVKSPKIYLRDTGILHALLRIADKESLLGHPVVGASWEGEVINNLIVAAPEGSACHFFRTAAGAEVDLVITLPNGKVWGVEVKRTSAPSVGKGFRLGCEALGVDRAFVACAAGESYPLADGIEASSVRELVKLLAGA